MDSIEYVGFVASTLATLAFLPQVVKTWRTRSADDFSLITLLMLEVGVCLWIVYGVWRDAPAIWLGNGVTLLLVGFILLVKADRLVGQRSCRAGRSRERLPARDRQDPDPSAQRPARQLAMHEGAAWPRVT